MSDIRPWSDFFFEAGTAFKVSAGVMAALGYVIDGTVDSRSADTLGFSIHGEPTWIGGLAGKQPFDVTVNAVVVREAEAVSRVEVAINGQSSPADETAWVESLVGRYQRKLWTKQTIDGKAYDLMFDIDWTSWPPAVNQIRLIIHDGTELMLDGHITAT